MKRLIFIIILTTSCVKHDVSKLNTNENIDFNNVPDTLIVVPSVLEAHDIIEMDEIERDLGF